jgi:hypothetical protein
VASFQSLRLLVAARRHPSAWLLMVQLAGVLLYPAMEGTPAGRAAFGAFGILVLMLALWVVDRSAASNRLAWCLAAASVGLTLWSVLAGAPAVLVYAHLFEAALYFYTAAALIAYMLRDHKVTSDELYAVGATFTLLAWGFAFAYAVCQAWFPGSFLAAVDPQQPRTWTELLFLSFSTLSGVGLTDILPVRPAARALVMLEAFAGVMYIALVVSRLIGLAIQRRGPAPADGVR